MADQEGAVYCCMFIKEREDLGVIGPVVVVAVETDTLVERPDERDEAVMGEYKSTPTSAWAPLSGIPIPRSNGRRLARDSVPIDGSFFISPARSPSFTTTTPGELRFVMGTDGSPIRSTGRPDGNKPDIGRSCSGNSSASLLASCCRIGSDVVGIIRARDTFFESVPQPNLGVLSALDFALAAALALEVTKEGVGVGSVRERPGGLGRDEVVAAEGIRTR